MSYEPFETYLILSNIMATSHKYIMLVPETAQIHLYINLYSAQYLNAAISSHFNRSTSASEAP